MCGIWTTTFISRNQKPASQAHSIWARTGRLVWWPLGGDCALRANSLVFFGWLLVDGVPGQIHELSRRPPLCWLWLTTKRGPAVDQRFFFRCRDTLGLSVTSPAGPTPPRVVVSERRPTNEVSTLKLSRFWVALQIAICAHQPQPSVPGLELYFSSRCFLSISDPTGWERNRSGHGRQKDHPSPNPSRNNLDFTVATKSERPRHNGFGSAHRHPRELGLARYPGRVPRRPQSEAGPNIPSVCLCVSWLGNGIAG